MSIFRIPIMIKVWAGSARHDLWYIRRSLPSLLRSDLPENVRVILIDDCSPNPRIRPFIEGLADSDRRVELWSNPYNMGPNEGQAYNFPRLVERFPQAPYYVLCDDDVIYHPGWLQRLIQVYEEAEAIGLRGVFSALNVPARPSYGTVRLPASEVLIKERQMALNWLLPRTVYEAVGPFRVTGLAFDHDYGLRLKAMGFPVVCLKPSFVQNIGYHGAYQYDDTLTAKDYIGRVGWDLRARDTWYAAKRVALQPAHTCYDRIPESRLKRFLRRVRRGLVRSVAEPISQK
jgi:glycosyltransferase involved in cell wall biosynthesis